MRARISRLAFCLLLYHVSPTWSAAPEPIGRELLENPGFEQVDTRRQTATAWKGFSTRDWGDCAGRAKPSDTRPHGGRACMEMFGVKNRYAAVHKKLTVEPHKAYLLTAWVRTALYGGESAFLVASWSSERRWLQLARSRPVRGHKDWARVSLVLSPDERPKGAKFVQVSFRMTSSSGRGRAWVDDISLRECRVPPPPLTSTVEPRRHLDMVRELLVERARWQERLRVLERRHADMQTILKEDVPFPQLATRYGDAARRRRFLTHTVRPHGEIERTVPTGDEAVRAQVEAIAELPQLRARCFEQLDATLRLKRQLDAKPALRRFYLWAQLAAARGEGKNREPAPVHPSPEYARAAASPPADTLGLLEFMDVRTELDPTSDVGVVRLSVAIPLDGQAERIAAGLFSPGNRCVSFVAKSADERKANLRLDVPSPNRWFPDCPHLYALRIGIFRNGKPVDWAERKVVFRDIRIVESDVTGTMRHAWRWAPTDYTFAINGQPYFPTGTVCGALREAYFDQAAALFDELWLDFQRTYGNYLHRLGGRRGDVFVEHGHTFAAALGPNYRRIRHYQSSRQGFDNYRDQVRDARRLASHPALLTIEVGNEAELSVWGADLPSVYGRDLWHVFNEATRVLRTGMSPTVPVGYVRASSFRSVLPAPRTDYSGVNQYTGRYSGRRCVINSALGALSLGATAENKPIGITEWNGPKYSWATRGVSGVDEEGAAQYIFEYFQNMLRTPMIVLSTEFVLNWVVTPLEDLTSVPLAEGLKRRARWRWSKQKGCPWYPHVWPDLLTDTPARRAMRGFQSPIHYLCTAPGPIVVASSAQQRPHAQRLVRAIERLGRRVSYMPISSGELDANLLLIGGHGQAQPEAVTALEDTGVIGRTTESFPPPGRFVIQRRVNPHFPDRFLVVVTAADAQGMGRAADKLFASAKGLEEALARQASCRRALALIDDNAGLWKIFATYVTELPTRGAFQGRDDLRTRLAPEEFFDKSGKLRARWADLGALIVATKRRLGEGELTLVRRLAKAGVNVVWSKAALRASPSAAKELAVGFGASRPLTEHLPVQQWAQHYLAVPDLGDAAADRVEKFGGLKRGSNRWAAAMTISELSCSQPWRAAAKTTDGKPVVIMRRDGKGAHWVFGCDLAAAAVALHGTTGRGVIHHIYDRDTACGLERIFRLVANACAFGRTQRQAATPRLRAEIETDRETYDWGDTMRVRVCVRDAEGSAQDADVRVGFGSSARFSQIAVPRRWMSAKRESKGTYTAQVRIEQNPRPDGLVPEVKTYPYRGQRFLTTFADVCRDGWVSDWTTRTVRVSSDTDEPKGAAELIRLVKHGLMTLSFHVEERETWIEIDAEATMPTRIPAGEPLHIDLAIRRIEKEDGNDWMEDVELVIQSLDGSDVVRLPVARGKYLTGSRASVARKRPDACILIRSDHPTRFDMVWPKAKAGRWQLRLRYRYTDEYHIKDTNRLSRDDPFAQGTFEVAP